MAYYPVFRQRFPADGYYTHYRKESKLSYAFGTANAPFAGSKSNITHRWKGDSFGSGGSKANTLERCAWNLKEYGTHKVANQHQGGYEYPTGPMKAEDSYALNTHVNDQSAIKVHGEVKNLFEKNYSNSENHIIGELGAGNKCVTLTVSDSTSRAGMFFFTGIKTPIVYENTSTPVSFNVTDCDCNFLEDVTGVSFDYSYLGSHGDSKSVHPYIKNVWMLYATHNYHGSYTDLNKKLYMFTREASVTLSGKMDKEPDDSDHVNSRDYNVSLRISDKDRSDLVKEGLMGLPGNRNQQQRAYWIGIGMKIEFPKKKTATVTRTINLTCMRPIISRDGTYTKDQNVNHWAFGKDKRMFDSNYVFHSRGSNPNRIYMG